MKSSPHIQKYLAMARGGRTDSRDNGYANFTANPAYFNQTGNAGAAPQPMPMGGQGMMAQPPKSRPYIVTVSNGTNLNVPNFNIMGAYTYLQNSGFSGGSLTISGVTISSGIAGVTYQFLLYQSEQNPFTIGRTLLQATTISAQILQPINVVTTDASGLSATTPLIPIIDPYQNQTNTLVMDDMYRVDGSTTLVITNVLPNAVFNILMYPSTTINPARGLNNAPAQAYYSAPGIIRNNVAVVPAAGGAGATVVSRLN